MRISSLKSVLIILMLALATTAGHAGGDNASKYYEDALARFEANDTAAAIIQLKNALQQDPKMIAAHVLLGRAYLRTADPQAAEDHLAKALDLGVSRSEIAVPLAQALYEQAKFKELLERLPPETAATTAQRLELLVLRGHAYRSLGDTQSANQAYEQARSTDPKYVPAILSEVDLLAHTGKRAEAERLIEQAIAVAPIDPRVWGLRASVAHGYGDVATALASYDKTLSLDPTFLEARIGRAGLLVDLNRLNQADQELQSLRGDVPKEPRVLYLTAVILSKRGDAAGTRDALIEVTRVLDPLPLEELKRRIPQGLLLGGLSHYGLNEMEKAVEYLAAYVAANPRHAGSRKLLGSIYVSSNNFRDAVSVLEPARKDAPYDPDVLALLAAAYMGRGQNQTANAYLEQALQLSGNAPSVQATLGFSLLSMGQRELGTDYLQRAYARNPSQTRVGMALVVVRLKRGEVKAALEVAEKVAKAESKSPATHNLLGVTRLAAGDRTGARAAYRKALEVDKAFLPAELNLCRLDLAEGNIAAARGRMQGVLKARPNNAQAMLEMALVEEAAGRAEDALRWLEKLHALDRRNVVATTRLVDSLIRAGKADKALEVAKETIGVAPEDLAALAALGQAYLALGDAKQAQVAFGRMTRLAAFDTGWQYRIAQYQVSAGNPDGATYSLERVLANQPDHLPAQVLLAEVELRRGQFDKAEQRARTLAGSQSTEAVGYRLLGDIALAQGRGSDAVASYRAALDRQSDPGVAVRLYQAYFAAGQSSAGLEFMQVWSQKYPKDALAAKALAEGYLRVGNLTAARSSYEALLKQQPDNPELLNNLASVLARQGDPRALELAERAHALAPNDAAVQDTLGWLLVRAGKLETGLRHLREARLRAPQNPEIRYHLAAALAEVGRKEEARAELDEALKIPVALEDTEAVRRLQQRLTSP